MTDVSGMPETGKKAPAFTLENGAGEKVALSKMKECYVVLYFYPRDNTPGCTVEAQQFRDHLDKFSQLDTVVMGVSPDTVATHAKFSEKHSLGFQLLADPEHVVAEKYGVWVEKNMYGKKRMGIQRSTFLIDKGGKILQVWTKVKADGHAASVLEALRGLK
jgi:peroxiredoxin Q/BCP